MSQATEGKYVPGSQSLLRRLFFPMSEEDACRGTDEINMSSDDEKLPNGGGEEGRESESSKLKAGKRSEHWFERVQEEVKENRKRSIKNQNYLTTLDYRTAWIMRVLVALLGTIISAVIAQILLL